MEITYEIAKKVLDTVNSGLVRGLGKAIPGNMCVEAAVCFAMGLPHDDNPPCVSPALRNLKIRLNDFYWSSKLARANGLRELALLQLGTAGVLDEKEFIKRVVLLVINKYLPPVLRRAHLNQKADACEQAKDLATARAAAYDAYNAAPNASRGAARSARGAAYNAYDAAHYAASDAAYDAAHNTIDVASTVYIIRNISNIIKGNAILLSFAKDVTGILIDMKVPGVQWLNLLTEQKGE
jgi:hypothetical protein